MSLTEKIRGQNWQSVTAVTADTYAIRKPKQEERERGIVGCSLGSYGANEPAVTAVTNLFQPLAPTRPTVASDRIFPSHLPRLVLDIETYYDRSYNLEKLDIVTYTFDPRFHIHGIAVHYPDGRSEFRTDVEVLLAELRLAYGDNLERVIVVFHNGYFDYFALYHHFGLTISHIADTMLLSRLIHGSDEDHDLEALAQRYGLPAKGDLSFMEGVRDPDAGQLELLRAYAQNDVNITAALADRLVPIVAQRPIELWAAEHSIKMFIERPMAVDASLIPEAQAALEASIAAKVAASGIDEKTIRSTQRFPVTLGAALAKTGRTVPTKPGKKGPNPAIAKNDPARAILLTDSDPAVRALMEAKVAVGSAGDSRSRLNYLGAMTRATHGNGHFQHSYHRAGPGRYAGAGGFNLQNLKHFDPGEMDTSVAARIRRSICAPAGMVLVSADASQIEARVLAFLAGQQDLHDAFAGGRDIYSEFAAKHLHREVRKPRDSDSNERKRELKTYRQLGKRSVLGLGYNMGVTTFIEKMKADPLVSSLFVSGVLSEPICASIVYGYRNQYPKIKQFWADCENAARSAMQGVPATVAGMLFHVEAGTLYIRLLSGRELVYPRIREVAPSYEPFQYIDQYGVTITSIRDRPGLAYGDGFNMYGGLIVENIVQGTSRDLLVDAMFRLESAGIPVLHHCHDAITVAVPVAAAEETKRVLIEVWHTIPTWMDGLVLTAEAQSGMTLADI